MGVDVVGETQHVLVERSRPLHRHFQFGLRSLIPQVHHPAVEGFPRCVQMEDEVPYAALVTEHVRLATGPVVRQPDLQATVQECELAHALRDRVVAEDDGVGEYLGVRPERDGRSGVSSGRALLDRGLRLAPLEQLGPCEAVAHYLRLETRRQGIDDRHPDPVQASGDGVGALLELSSRVQRGQNRGQGGLARAGMSGHRNASPVVGDPAPTVCLEFHMDLVRVAGHRLVHGVVDHLPHEMVQAARARRAYVHPRTAPDRLQTGEYLYVFGAVARRLLRSHAFPRCSIPAAGPSATLTGQKVPFTVLPAVTMGASHSTSRAKLFQGSPSRPAPGKGS